MKLNSTIEKLETEKWEILVWMFWPKKGNIWEFLGPNFLS